MPDAVHACTHLAKMPLGTPPEIAVAQVFSEKGSELDTPFPQGFVTDLHTTLVQHFLNAPVTQGTWW